METAFRLAHVAGRKEVTGAWRLPLIQVVKVGHTPQADPPEASGAGGGEARREAGTSKK